MSDPSNSTTAWTPPVCTEQNWSNSSALAVLFALAVGCLAHPPGSLTFNNSGRIWRLSPQFGLVEALHILIKLFISLRKNYSLHTACVTLLAIRTGNNWTSVEYEAFQEEWLQAQGSNSEEWESLINPEQQNSPEEYPVDDEVISPVGRSYTIDAEEGRANLRISRLSNAGLGNANISQSNNTPPEEPRLAFSDTLFLAQLREAEKHERGLVFRTIVWIPIHLALVKILSVRGRWSIWCPQICGIMFFASWLTVELTTIIASRTRLSPEQRDQAVTLSRGWRKPWIPSAAPNKISGRALLEVAELYVDEDPKGPSFVLDFICTIILLGLNTWPFYITTAPAYFELFWRYGEWMFQLTGLWSYPDTNRIFTERVFISVGVYAKDLFVFYILLFMPFLVYAGVYSILVYHTVTARGVRLLFVLLVSLVSSYGVREKTVASWESVFRVGDSDILHPGYLAMFQTILTVLRYTRVLNDYASYDCSTTSRASWYDWTL